MRLMAGTQYDTIYDEHFSYFSFLSLERILGVNGLKIFDIEELDHRRRLAPRLRVSGGRREPAGV